MLSICQHTWLEGIDVPPVASWRRSSSYCEALSLWKPGRLTSSSRIA